MRGARQRLVVVDDPPPHLDLGALMAKRGWDRERVYAHLWRSGLVPAMTTKMRSPPGGGPLDADSDGLIDEHVATGLITMLERLPCGR